MSELQNYRNEIDAIDRELLTLLAQRFEVVKKVWEYKKIHDLPPLQPGRWQEVLENRKSIARDLGLSEEFVVTLWNQIHDYALEIESIIKK